jgi:hypothetical protein
MRHVKIKDAILSADPYRLACSIRKRTGCTMKQARARVRAIRRMARPRVSAENLAQISRAAFKGNP